MNAYAVMCELKQLCDKSRKRCFMTHILLHAEEEKDCFSNKAVVFLVMVDFKV